MHAKAALYSGWPYQHSHVGDLSISLMMKKPADIIRANRDFSPWFLHRNNYNAQGVNYGDNITDSVKFLTS